ncbi:MAG: acylglycerol lipase [Rhodospirillaceae bacterium]|nr:acylglycerol lipase [Rhodospirillaceae bacterium]
MRAARAIALLLLPMLLVACAPRFQPLGPAVTRPSYAADRLLMDDGVALPLRHWPADGQAKAVILALHGFNDYSHAFALPAAIWGKAGIETYAYDQRGFGETPHRGLWPGDRRLIDDVRAAVVLLRARHPGLPLFLLGESMGGAVVMCAMTEPNPPPVDGVILSAPAAWNRGQLGVFANGLLWLMAHSLPWYTLNGHGLHIVPSDNRAMLEQLFRDPLVLKDTRTDTVYGLVALMDRAYEAAPRIKGRVLVLYGVHEQVIDDDVAAKMLRHLPRGPDAPRVAIYPDGYHMLMRDINGGLVSRDIAAWIFRPSAPLPSGADSRGQRLIASSEGGLSKAR